MNKIKTVKIKNEDGSVDQEAFYISADARNIDMTNGYNVQETIGTIDIDDDGNIAEQLNNLHNDVNNINLDIKKKAYYFNSVADMKNANLQNGDYAITLGYYNINDGGSGKYQILNGEYVDDGGSYLKLNNNLFAKLIIDNTVTVNQFGAYGDNSHDDTNAFISMLSCLNYIKLQPKTYMITGPIILHEKQSLFGENKENTIIHHTGTTTNCIESENIGTCRNIVIHDLTILGTNRQGYGIYFQRDTKNSDTYHRLYNLRIRNFNRGIYLEKHINEIQMSDIVCSGCTHGIYMHGVNDFYMERIVTAVNHNTGLYISNVTDGRLSDIKSWYNGSASPSTAYNILMTSCYGFTCTNIECQESYGSNMLLSYSKQIIINSGCLNKPGLDTTDTYNQLECDGIENCWVDFQMINSVRNSVYVNRLISLKNNNFANKINIGAEEDFPRNLFYTAASSTQSRSWSLWNEINIFTSRLQFNKEKNYAINGDLSYKEDFNFIQSGSNYCSFEGSALRIAAEASSSAVVNFKQSALDELGHYVFYIKFKKVSGTGNVTIDYNGVYTITESTSTDNNLYVSRIYNRTDLNSKTNLRLELAAGLTIDVYEIGICYGLTTQTGYPLDSKAIMN